MGFEFNEEKSAPFKEDDDITVFSMHMQSIFKASDELFPGILPVYNLMMEDIFGPTNSMFTRTTPKQFLFDGIEFCKDVTGDVFTLCDIIEQRESKSIVRSADGSSLKFSMFAHVSLKVINYHRQITCLIVAEKSNTRRSLRNKHWH